MFKSNIPHSSLFVLVIGFAFLPALCSGEKSNTVLVDKVIDDTCQIANIIYPSITDREGKGLDIPIPPNEHPRLFFRERDIPALQEKITNPLMKDCWNGIVQNAALVTDGKLIQKDSKHNLNMIVVNAIEAKAFLYAFQNNRLTGKEAVIAMINLNSTLIPNYANPLVYRELGRVILATAIVYDWCYDLIGEHEKKFLIARMETWASKMEFKWPQLNQGSVSGHGVEAQLLRDMLACGIATYNEKPEIYKLAAGRLFAEIIPALNFFYPAAYHNQGSAYGPYRFQWEMYPTLLYDRMGYPNIVSKFQGQVPYRWIYTRRPDGQLLRDGDNFTEQSAEFGKYWAFFGNAHPKSIYNNTQQYSEPVVCPLAFTASYYKDSILMGEVMKQKLIGKDVLFDFILINPLVPATTNLSVLPLTKYFNEPLGSMVARTGWGEGFTSTAVVVEMKIGIYNVANHQHLDAGNFQIYYKGPLAVNSGIYQGKTGGYGCDHFINYYQRSIAHNTMLINNPQEKFMWQGKEIINDGGQQYPNGGSESANLKELLAKDYKRGEVLAHDFGPDSIKPEFTYIKGELAKAYPNKVKSFKRSFVFLNLNNSEVPATLIVFDRVNASNKEYKKSWLLHCVEEPIIIGNVTTVIRREKGYDGQLVNTTLLPVSDNLIINKVGGQGNEYSVSGRNFPQTFVSENNSGDGAIWRVEVSPKKGDETDNFLNVMQVMDYAGGTRKPFSAKKLETDLLVGTSIGDRVVLFSKNGKVIDQPIVIKIENDGSTKVLITDINKGNWKVECLENMANSQGVISNSRNLLYFYATKGTYRMTPVN